MWGFHLPMHIRKEGYTSVEGLEACSAYASARCLFAWLGYHRASVSSRDALSEGLSHLGRGQQFPLIALQPLPLVLTARSMDGLSLPVGLTPVE